MRLEIAAHLDTAQAVTLPMAAGEMVFFNNAICLSARPNMSDDRRVLMLIEYVPTHAYQHDPRESAMLVRGRDGYGNFDQDSRPEAEMSKAARAAWRRKVKVQASVLYRGAKQTPRAHWLQDSGRGIDPLHGCLLQQRVRELCGRNIRSRSVLAPRSESFLASAVARQGLSLIHI